MLILQLLSIHLNSVYLINSDGTISEKEIEVGLSNWQVTEVLGGLSLDDQIVLSIDRKGLEDGVKVSVEETNKDKDEVSIEVEIG